MRKLTISSSSRPSWQLSREPECLSVIADDTDVYILLLRYYNQKEFNIPMFVESPVHGRQTIDIRATAKEHANILPKLLATHGLSGCDTVAPCYGIGENENT